MARTVHFRLLPYFAVLSLFLFGTFASGTIIRVPEDEPTIQAGIDAAADGDTVLVSTGTYTENINFNGKGILVASHYVLDQDPLTISSTVIDGSQPAQPDTASCVLFISGEDSTSILEGFTLTGGTGTRWTDEHGAGVFVEGGGILSAFASPTIRHNVITGNEAIRTPAGTSSAGGGGIRCGDGAPLIANNVITVNSGMYGGGIVMNYASGTIRNNIISENRVYQAVPSAPTYGGGGIWVNGSGFQTTIENNTIFGNSSEGTGGQTAGRGGGLLVWGATVDVLNNIIWGNTQTTGGPIRLLVASATITYCDVEGGIAGEGNIDQVPLFGPENFYLSDGSPCIDAGDTSSVYNDPEDPGNPGSAEWPSRGGLRNDMGAYGGPERAILADTPTLIAENPEANLPRAFALDQNYPNPFNPSTTIRYTLDKPSDVVLQIFNLRGQRVKTLVDGSCPAGTHAVLWDGQDDHGRSTGSGIYLYRLKAGGQTLSKKMILMK